MHLCKIKKCPCKHFEFKDWYLSICFHNEFYFLELELSWPISMNAQVFILWKGTKCTQYLWFKEVNPWYVGKYDASWVLNGHKNTKMKKY